MKITDIPFLNGVTDLEEVTEGHSNALKYSFTKNGRSYFLKIGPFKIMEGLEEELTDAKIPHAKIVEWGSYDEKKNYIIEELAEGINLKYKIDNYEAKFIYEFAFKMGKQYSHLRQKYKDKPVGEEFLDGYRNEVMNRVDELSKSLERSTLDLEEREIAFIRFLISYLKNNFDIMKKGLCVFGHCDIKPSNFLLYKNHLIATDIEHTDYKELSSSMIWSYARNDKKDDKYLYFTRGYLDGLFNLNVPKNALETFNYTYMYNMAHYCCHYLNEEKHGKLEKLISHIKKNYIQDGKMIVDRRISSDASIEYFPQLTDCDFTIVDGSYDGDNLVFKCTNGIDDYFLKIIKTSKERFNRLLKGYDLLKENHIPASLVRGYGECQRDKSYYIIFNFLEGKHLKNFLDLESFQDGYKYGQRVAEYFKQLKKKRVDFLKTYDKQSLYEDIIKRINSLYSFEDWYLYMRWSKEEVLTYVDKYISSFDEEPIGIVHRDLKFGNILSKDGESIYFVDNESLVHSYDITNFLYNLQDGFVPDSKQEAYRGYVNGFMKLMNDGVIPVRIKNQARLILLCYLIRLVLNYLEKNGESNKIEMFTRLCDEYVFNDKEIGWLQ